MSDTQTIPALEISRTFKAPRAQVFAAFTQPELLAKWFGPPTTTFVNATVDLRVGGRYRIHIRGEEDYIVSGVFTEIQPPARLAYTWAWEEDEASPTPETMSGGESLVTIELVDRGNETEMLFKQEHLASMDAVASHNAGWTGSFDKLSALLAS